MNYDFQLPFTAWATPMLATHKQTGDTFTAIGFRYSRRGMDLVTLADQRVPAADWQLSHLPTGQLG